MVNHHFLNRYTKLINFFKTSFRDGYNEKHHIIPKCLGGNNEPENIILLPARAHFICHYLLHKAYPTNRKLAHAFAMMGVNNEFQNRSSRLYEKTKLARSLALKGVKRPEWVKKKLRTPKATTKNYKKPKSESHKHNISNSLKNKKHDWHQKILQSDGYIAHQKKKKDEREKKIVFHRNNFKHLKLSRKEYYLMFPEINPITLKKYLTGL